MTKEKIQSKEEVAENLKKTSKPETRKESIVEEKRGDTDFVSQHKTIHSHELLKHGKEVFIQHKGEQYLLRCTRNGKLILTK
jgi:hemin uptake protein HemP